MVRSNYIKPHSGLDITRLGQPPVSPGVIHIQPLRGKNAFV